MFYLYTTLKSKFIFYFFAYTLRLQGFANIDLLKIIYFSFFVKQYIEQGLESIIRV